ncbi:hypothetical protein E4V42_21085 [Clostridium estertheticum]|uniref:Uncharacterized protein n=1 Tax=Clostridium estertheticum TaxID=238834 RepID=A0A5N7J877_9CLOT|nr:DUF6609 family protein [Clostridium estertheticum]MPQ33898.1 hypothetical protein [Clostridium estertheticum]MPQ64912.1 hypothetical protein [Clostridium estertheticum]
MVDENNKVNDFKYPYPRQKIFGLFLIGVSITMALATILGTNQYPNALVFIIGYIISMVGIMFNKKVRTRFSIGESTPLQEKASKFSLTFISVIVPIIGMSLSRTGNYRLIWLLILLAVGIHFIPFTLVHGKLTLMLAILTIINSCIGLYLFNTSFVVFGIIDAIIKLIIGIVLFKFSPFIINKRNRLNVMQ